MATLAAISLDDHWHAGYFRTFQTDEIADGPGGTLGSMSDWAGLEFPNSAARAWRTFRLEPTDFCVRYYLHIGSTPQLAAITINEYGINLPDTPPPFKFDVTDYVVLGENVICFVVTGGEGTFGHVRLQAVACDDL